MNIQRRGKLALLRTEWLASWRGHEEVQDRKREYPRWGVSMGKVMGVGMNQGVR